jgi:hypothetical protein
VRRAGAGQTDVAGRADFCGIEKDQIHQTRVIA